MVKWPFQRNQDESIDLATPDELQEQLPVEEQSSEVPEQQELSELPAEVQEYYQSERQQRSGMAWLLGLATLGATLVLALGLFFGGRWVYRKVANPAANNPANQQVVKSNDKQKPGATGDSNKQNQGTSSTNTTSPSTNPVGPTPTPQPATGKTTPNTGSGDVVVIFALTSIAGILLYQVVARRQTN